MVISLILCITGLDLCKPKKCYGYSQMLELSLVARQSIVIGHILYTTEQWTDDNNSFSQKLLRNWTMSGIKLIIVTDMGNDQN